MHDDVDHVVTNLATAQQLDRGQTQPLLVHFGCTRTEAAGHHAAGIGPVAGVGEVRPQAIFIEEGLHHLHVHQVRAAEIRIVDDDDVTGPEIVPVLDDGLGCRLHDAQENG